MLIGDRLTPMPTKVALVKPVSHNNKNINKTKINEDGYHRSRAASW